jgi:nitronate monooxygenase
VHTGLFDVGWPDAPHRVLRNRTYDAWEAAGRPAPGARPGEGEVLAKGRFGDMVRYESTTPRPDAEGDIEAMSLWAGQGVARLRRVQPAGEIVREIADEAAAVLRDLGTRA